MVYVGRESLDNFGREIDRTCHPARRGNATVGDSSAMNNVEVSNEMSDPNTDEFLRRTSIPFCSRALRFALLDEFINGFHRHCSHMEQAAGKLRQGRRLRAFFRSPNKFREVFFATTVSSP